MFTEPRAKAEVLNNQFSSVLNNEETEDISDHGKKPTPTIRTLTIPTSGIEKQLPGLNGPDRIPPWLLKGECPGNVEGSY